MTAPHPQRSPTLAQDGYCILPGLIDEAWRLALLARLDGLIAEEGPRAGLEVHQEVGTNRLANLVDKGPVFDPLWTHPAVHACVAGVLGRPFKLSSLNAREPQPGMGHQGLHADWGPRVPTEPFHVVNSLWVLDGMDSSNGATRLVPGSHLVAGSVADHVADQAAAHPRQVVLDVPPGTVVVFNAHAWHGGTVNASGARRRVIHGYFTAAEHPGQSDFTTSLSPATRARLSADHLRMLGVTG